MYFVRREGRYIDVAGQSFRDFLEGGLPALPNEPPTIEDWEDHVSTVFPEVRLKRFLEMRGADGGPWRKLCAKPALWVGLLYHGPSLDAALSLAGEMSLPELQALRRDAPRLGLEARAGKRSLRELARDVLDLSLEGLKARARLDGKGRDERHFLEPLREVVEGRTIAERLLESWRGPWGGSVDPVFQDHAY